MEFIATLGVALGLAMLAGVNLYLTIFLTGLAVSLDKISDAGLAAALEGFGHPAVIAVALGLYVVQFIADKVPWVDSLWDSIHTFLKPAGGILLALTSLGPDASGFATVLVTILALAGSLLTHGVKAGTRLTINTSPEPFSNIGVSVLEDALVIGGALLILYHPVVAFFVFAALLGLFAYLTPRVTRATRAILWLIWKKLRVPAGDKSADKKKLPRKLPADAEAFLLDEFGSEKYKVAFCVPCVTGKTRNTGRLCRNLFGDLIAIDERPGKLFFVGKRSFRKFIETIDLGGALATHESRFISEGIIIHNKKSKLHANLRFHRGQEALAERLTDYLQDRISEFDARQPAEDSEKKPEAVDEKEKAPKSEKAEETEEKSNGMKIPPLAPLPSLGGSESESDEEEDGKDMPRAAEDDDEPDLPRADDDDDDDEPEPF